MRLSSVFLVLLGREIFNAHSFHAPNLAKQLRKSVALKLKIDKDKHLSGNGLVYKAADFDFPVTGSFEIKPPANDNFLRVIYDFSRPHTLIGSALSIPSLCLFATGFPINLQEAKYMSTLIAAAMIPSLLINIYITGLNQITDVEIDRVNKPELVIASGRLSMKAAIIVVIACLFSGVGLGYLMPPNLTSHALQGVILGSTVLGTMYSLPPFRLKRFPLLAAFCILGVRGAIMNTCFYAHFKLKTALLAAPSLGFRAMVTDLLMLPFKDVKCGLLVAYFAIFGIVIALLKDVPDYTGDAQFNIRSFTVRIGRERVFAFTTNLMIALLWGSGSAFLASAFMQFQTLETICIRKLIVSLIAIVAGKSVLDKRTKVDPKNPNEVYKFYMYLWGLFYGSYLSIPILP